MSYRYSKYLPAFAFFGDLLLLNISFYSYNTSSHRQFFDYQLFTIVNLNWMLLAPLFRIYRFSRPIFLRDNFNKFFQVLFLHFLAVLFFTYIIEHQEKLLLL